MPPSFSHASVIDAKTASQCCDSLSTNSCTTATVSDKVSSGVDDDESSVMIGSSNRHAASSTKLVSGDPDDAAGIAFAFGLALAVMPLALLERVVSFVAVRSDTLLQTLYVLVLASYGAGHRPTRLSVVVWAAAAADGLAGKA